MLRKCAYSLTTYALVLISIFCLAFLVPLPVTAFWSESTIGSSGMIIYPGSLPRLYTEGRYIKNSLGQTVYLRGVQKINWEDNPTGHWQRVGQGTGDNWAPDGFPEEACRAQLRAMKQDWGCNVWRLHFVVVDWWIRSRPPYNQLIPHEGKQYDYDYNLERAVQISNEEGLYIVLAVGFLTKDVGDKSALPFPPYLSSTDKNNLIVSNWTQQDFINFWKDFAGYFDKYDNVIFDLWNEPGSGSNGGWEPQRTDWANHLQQLIPAVRSVTDNIICVQWHTCGANHAYEFIRDNQWLLDYQNIIFNNHWYRYHGSLGDQYAVPPNQTDVDSWYNWMKPQMEPMSKVLQEFNRPLVCWEVGCNNFYDTEPPYDHPEYWNEQRFMEASLRIFNEWNMSYTGHMWKTDGSRFGMLARYNEDGSWTSYIPPPNVFGQTLIDAIARA